MHGNRCGVVNFKRVVQVAYLANYVGFFCTALRAAVACKSMLFGIVIVATDALHNVILVVKLMTEKIRMVAIKLLVTAYTSAAVCYVRFALGIVALFTLLCVFQITGRIIVEVVFAAGQIAACGKSADCADCASRNKLAP